MIPSPLHLKNYFVSKLSIRANEIAEGAQYQLDGGLESNTTVQPARRSESSRDWRIVLQISCTPKQKNLCTYFVDMELVGFFEADKSIEEDRVQDIVLANGPALLYSAARELVLIVTGRGPFPPLMLPSTTFIDLCPSLQKKVAAQKGVPEPVSK
jgi:preprotein translocase subunit SecB